MGLSIQQEKSAVFGQIAAAKVLIDDTNSKINQGQEMRESLRTISKDPINFLVDLVSELVGYESLKKAFSNILVNKLNDIEDKVKYAIKLNLKSLVNCGTNPEIPTNLKYSGQGYEFKLKDVDYSNIFKLSPTSTYGGLIYSDIDAQLNSVDLNTVLYNIIQDKDVEHLWGSQVGYGDITAFTFKPNTGNGPNMINIKASDNYSTNKKLTDWNNDYVDSVDLFPDTQFFGKVMDSVFNVFSQVIDKTVAQANVELLVDNAIDRLTNTDPNEFIDDSFFNVSNSELVLISEKARLKVLGITKLEGCYGYPQVTKPINVSNSMNAIASANGKTEKLKTVAKSIDNMANVATGLGNEQNKYTIKLNFFTELIKTLVKTITNMILSPKLILLFLVNFKIVDSTDTSFTGVDELMKIMKSLLKEIIDQVKGIVVSELLNIAMKEIKNMQGKVVGKIGKELVVNKQKVLLSLVGVPQDIIRLATKF